MTGLRRSIETLSVLEPISKERKLVLASKDPVGKLVQLRERLNGGVFTNKHKLSRGQSFRYLI